MLEDTTQLLEAKRERDLAQQEQFLTTAAAEAAVRERKERVQALDEARFTLILLADCMALLWPAA